MHTAEKRVRDSISTTVSRETVTRLRGDSKEALVLLLARLLRVLGISVCTSAAVGLNPICYAEFCTPSRAESQRQTGSTQSWTWPRLLMP